MNKNTEGFVSILPVIVVLMVFLLTIIFFVLPKNNQLNLGWLFPKLIHQTSDNYNQCKYDSNCVIGINPTSCCYCPEAVNRNSIGKAGWEIYDPNKRYQNNNMLKKLKGCNAVCKQCVIPQVTCKNNQCTFFTAPDPNLFENWKTYRNEKYGFEIRHDPELNPTERDGGGETVGQFTFLQSISFGSVFLKSPHSFVVEINQKFSVDDYRTDIIGHIADKIDFVEKAQINGNSWTKLSYKVSSTKGDVPVIQAVLNNRKYGYAITAGPSDIDQILSTFKFIGKDEKIVQGKVIENNLGCGADAECYLRINTNNKDIKIIYHYGELPRCANSQATRQGTQIKAGESVEVFGKVKAENEISTCDSEKYYIQKIND